MTQDSRQRIFGDTISNWIVKATTELNIDAVGLWQIVLTGRHDFNLDGDKLIDYIRRNIIALLEAGAVPVYGGVGTEFDWIYQPKYGNTNDEIVQTSLLNG